MGQHKPRVLEPQFSPKQQVEIQRAGSPTLLSLTISAATPLQMLHVLQQLECRHLRRRPLHMRDQKDGIAIRVLARRSSERLGFQKRGAAQIPSFGIAPIQKQVAQARNNPAQGGFRRSVATAQIGPEPNGKRCFEGEQCHCKRRVDKASTLRSRPCNDRGI